MPSDVIEGDLSFRNGMNSNSAPWELPPGFYATSMNTINRGGILRCRPGYNWKFTLPDGNLQGMFAFQVYGALPQLLFAVDGLVYVSEYPYETYRKIRGIQFDKFARCVYWCKAEQSVIRNKDGSLRLITPRSLVFMQDYKSAPAYWDGSHGLHVRDKVSIPFGGPMAWSGSRLWVARGERLFASDIVNPLSFQEGRYLSSDTRESEVFVLPGKITALAETTSLASPLLLAFTDTTTTAIQSNIRSRELWSSVPDFQRLLFPGIGCVSHRSAVSKSGLLFWYTAQGLTSFNAAMLGLQNSKFDYTDTEMSGSKANLDADLSGIAASVFENYLLVSVPHTDVFNRHTWVMDSSTEDQLNMDFPPVWNSYWTGTRPVEWGVAVIEGASRIFHVSKDYDGRNRLWEAFGDDMRDSECDIQWTVEFRGYAGKTPQMKTLRYAKLWLSELSGTVDVKMYWAGSSRGRFKDCLTKRIVANEGILEANTEIEATDEIFALKPQSRTLKTVDIKKLAEDNLTSAVFEFPEQQAEFKDTAFQFLFVGCGPGAIRGIQVFMELETEQDVAKCEEDETGEKLVRFDGAAAETPEALQASPLEFFQAVKTSMMTQGDVTVSDVGYASSVISQEAADKVAQQIADRRCVEKLYTQATKFLGGELA